MSQNLSILVDKGGFSFCVWKHQQLQLHSYISLHDKGMDTMFQNLYLQQAYDDVKCAVLTEQYTLIPNEHFNDNVPLDDWLSLNAKVFENDLLFEEKSESADLHWIYAIDSELKKQFDHQFPTINWQHAGQLFLDSLASQTNDAGVFINLHPSQMEIAAFREGNLQLYNIFPVQTSNDLLYFVLSVYRQIEFDTNADALYFFGKIEDAWLQRLLSFVRHVIPGHEQEETLQYYTHQLLQ